MTANAPATATDICVPWRAQPDRLPAWNRVQAFWRDNGFNIITADSNTESFALTEARNNAVRQSTAHMVIVADADTIPDLGAVHTAITDLQLGDVCWPFETYRHIPGDTVTQSDLHAITPNQTYRASVGGLFITHRETYWQLGGMDERFEPRWGYEDNAWDIVVRTLGNKKRTPGCIYSFDHTADRDMTTNNPNRHRHDLYRACDGKPELIRELIKR